MPANWRSCIAPVRSPRFISDGPEEAARDLRAFAKTVASACSAPCFRGIDDLTALTIAAELGDAVDFPPRPASWRSSDSCRPSTRAARNGPRSRSGPSSVTGATMRSSTCCSSRRDPAVSQQAGRRASEARRSKTCSGGSKVRTRYGTQRLEDCCTVEALQQPHDLVTAVRSTAWVDDSVV